MIDRFFPIALLTMTLLGSPALAEDITRQISVNGSGEILVVPDRASVTMGVEMRARTLESARDQVGEVVGKFLSLADRMGIEKKHLNTSQLTIRPEYDWVPAVRKRNLTGYYVARQVHVELQDLDQLGALLERATEVGINQVSGPVFSSSRHDELQREALKKAAEDARRNAEVLAGSLGARLGPVRDISAGSMHRPPPRPMGRAMAMAADGAEAEQSYEVGEMRLQAQVSVVFDLVVDP